MQRKRYYQWIAIAVGIIAVVVLLLIQILKHNKQQTTDEPVPTASPSASPTISASDLPTATPTATPKPSPSPTTTTSHTAAARAAYANKHYPLAIGEYLQAIEATSSPSELATLWLELGNTYRDNQNSAEALNAYTRATSYNTKLGDAYLNKAALQWSQEAKDNAISTLEAGIAADASRKTDLQNTLDVYKALNK